MSEEAGLVVTRRARSRSPSPKQRRQSFSDTDVFQSPIQWSHSPQYDRDVDEVARVIAKGSIMCRDKINAAYIRELMNDSASAVWFIRDAKARIFGFAFTKQKPASVLEVQLLCVHKRRGEGMKLFADILRHAIATRQEIHLEAINRTVASLYAAAAYDLKVAVHVGTSASPANEVPRRRIEAVLEMQPEKIPMVLRPSTVLAPKKIEFDPTAYMKQMQRLRQMEYDEEEDDD